MNLGKPSHPRLLNQANKKIIDVLASKKPLAKLPTKWPGASKTVTNYLGQVSRQMKGIN